MIELLFQPSSAAEAYDALLYQALMLSVSVHPRIKVSLTDWYESFMHTLHEELCAEHPDATDEDCSVVATGILALYFNAESMGTITDGRHLDNLSQQAAQRLLETL